jgi:hypothetical protein
MPKQQINLPQFPSTHGTFGARPAPKPEKPVVERVAILFLQALFGGLLISIALGGLSWVAVSLWADVLSKI